LNAFPAESVGKGRFPMLGRNAQRIATVIRLTNAILLLNEMVRYL
jgi:hypothetical protein